MSKYIMYCKSCEVVKIDESNLECKHCLSKMEDIGFVESSIEEAIWWGQSHPGVSIDLGPMFHAQIKQSKEDFENALKNGTLGKKEW